MPDARSSSPAKRALAAELRRAREITGMSGDDVAGQLRWSPSKISRIETNRTGVKTQDLSRLLDLYGVGEAQRSQLAALADEPEPHGWWNAYVDSIDPIYASYIVLEASAHEIRCWSPELVHGLLQTEGYASAIMAVAFGSPPSVTPREIQDRIEIRMRRQSLLTGPDLKHFEFILDEAALLRQFGSPDVMRRQLEHVGQVSRLPNVTVRVLPFAGLHPVVTSGAFAVLDFEPLHGTAISGIVYTEQVTRNDILDEEDGAHEYRLAFERLTEVALDPEESREIIARTALERWS